MKNLNLFFQNQYVGLYLFISFFSCFGIWMKDCHMYRESQLYFTTVLPLNKSSHKAKMYIYFKVCSKIKRNFYL